MRPPLTIAVDGPAASGKGTIARALAAHYRLPHLDTGSLYRALALEALAGGLALDDGPALAALARRSPLVAPEPQLRAPGVGEAASRVSVHPDVRRALVARQRGFAQRAEGAVLDGRDIGTVILPGAAAKLFVTAALPVRAERRQAEWAAAGRPALLAEVEEDLRRRDARDEGRAAAPLSRAGDALLLDTSRCDRDQSIARAIAMVDERVAAAQPSLLARR